MLSEHVERVNLTSRYECLIRLILFSANGTCITASVPFWDHYHFEWAQSSRDSRPPIRELPEKLASRKMEQIEVKSYVCGLVTSSEREAAQHSNFDGCTAHQRTLRTEERAPVRHCPTLSRSGQLETACRKR